jgi:hypothetical protein
MPTQHSPASRGSVLLQSVKIEPLDTAYGGRNRLPRCRAVARSNFRYWYEKRNVYPKTTYSSARAAAAVGRSRADTPGVRSLWRHSLSLALGAPQF